MYKALIVDDNESVCESLERALISSGDFCVAGKLSNADHAVIYCQKLLPDLVYMDVCTEGETSGLDVIKVLREKFPGIKIIAMSGFDEITFARRAKEYGAHAFIFKSQSFYCFTKAASLVMRGGTYFPDEKTPVQSDRESPLSSRETQILKLLCRHMTNAEIATELFLNEDAVMFHKKSMLEKTGFANCVDLALHAISHCWIDTIY